MISLVKRLGDAFYNILPILTIASLFWLIYALALNITAQTPLFICDNPHDFFIPVASGYAYKNGYALHDDFHSVFGWFYAAMNALTLLIIEIFPTTLSLNSLPSISSAVFAVISTAVFGLIYYFSPKKFGRILFLILVLVLAIIFQLKSRTDWSVFSVAPVARSIYNNHLWGLILLQVTHAFIFMNGSKQKKNIAIAAMLQALMLYIFFSYKISFLLASLFISASLSVFLPLKEILRYGLYTTATFALLLIATASFGYSYGGYISDILSAVEAKKSIYQAYLNHMDDLKAWNARIPVFTAYEAMQVLFISTLLAIYFIIQNGDKYIWKKAVFYRTCAFIILCVFAFFVAMQGDYDKPHLYVWLAALIFVLINPLKNFDKLFHCAISCFFLSLVFVSIFSIRISNSQNNKASQGFHILDFALASQDTHHRFHFTLLDKDVVQEQETRTKTNDEMLFTSYKLLTPNFIELYEKIPQTANYIKMLSEVMEKLRSLNIEQDEKLFLLEFNNPLPFLTGSKIPQHSLNWIHMGVTVSTSTLINLHPIFEDSDMVIVPTKSMDGNAGQMLNCEFYQWNFGTKKYKIFQISENAIYLGSNDFLTRHNFKQVYDITAKKNHISETCAEVKKNFLEYLWTYPT